jgi:hypothetical protein
MPTPEANPKDKTPLWLLLLTIAIPLSTIIISLIQPWIELDQLYRDPVRASAIMVEQGVDINRSHLRPLVGAISNFGVIMWCAAASVSLFAACVVDRHTQRSWFFCLLAMGFLTTLLLVDDLFQAHEAAYPVLFGLYDMRIFASYAVLLIAFVFIFRRLVMRYGLLLFLMSMFMLAAAAGFDVFFKRIDGAYDIWQAKTIQRIGEDGLKLIGITAWLSFTLRLSWLAIREPKPPTT